MIEQAVFFLGPHLNNILTYPVSGTLSEEMNLTKTCLFVRENKWDMQCHIYSISAFYFDNQSCENVNKNPMHFLMHFQTKIFNENKIII